MYRHNLISSGVFSEHVSLGGGVFHLLGLFLCLETLGVEIWHTVTNSTTLLYKARKSLVISMLTLKKPQGGGGGGHLESRAGLVRGGHTLNALSQLL